MSKFYLVFAYYSSGAIGGINDIKYVTKDFDEALFFADKEILDYDYVDVVEISGADYTILRSYIPYPETSSRYTIWSHSDDNANSSELGVYTKRERNG